MKRIWHLYRYFGTRDYELRHGTHIAMIAAVGHRYFGTRDYELRPYTSIGKVYHHANVV